MIFFVLLCIERKKLIPLKLAHTMFAAVIALFHMSSEHQEVHFLSVRETWREARGLIDAEMWVLAADLCAAAQFELDTSSSLPEIFADLETRAGYHVTFDVVEV
jgi:hypothetical protein